MTKSNDNDYKFYDQLEREFLKREKANFFNYLLETLDDYDELQQKPLSKQVVVDTFNQYNNKKIVIDMIVDNLKKSNDHITNGCYIELTNYYYRNYDTTMKKAINTKDSKDEPKQSSKNKLVKHSIIGFLIGRYFDKLILIATLAFFYIIAKLHN